MGMKIFDKKNQFFEFTYLEYGIVESDGYILAITYTLLTKDKTDAVLELYSVFLFCLA